MRQEGSSEGGALLWLCGDIWLSVVLPIMKQIGLELWNIKSPIFPHYILAFLTLRFALTTGYSFILKI